MNYEAERAMNQKRLRMDGEPGHGVIQGNGLPLNYMDNGHQIPYQPYAGAYNTHYPPPDAFAAYGPPPPGGYAPQNLSYAPPAHQNYPHHQSFPPQQPQAQLHMPQTHMVQGYGDVGMHKGGWPQHLLPPLDTQKPLDVKQLKPEIKLEPTDPQKRPHPENEMMGGDLDQPKIKIKTDIFKPDDPAHRQPVDKPHDVLQKPVEALKPVDQLNKDIAQPIGEVVGEKVAETSKNDSAENKADPSRPDPNGEKKEGSVKRESFSSPERAAPGKSPGGALEPKKRGRPKGSTNKPKPPGAPPRPPAPAAPRPPAAPRAALTPGRPRASYQYAVRPFRKDFSGIQFRRRWSDDCLDSSHIPNEVYFGDVPVSSEVLFNYYDANAEREKLAAQAAHIAAQKAAAAKLAAARAQARGLLVADTNRVTTVDSSSDDSSESGSDSEDSDDDAPLKRGPGRPKGAKSTPKKPSTPGAGTGARRGRPPVPPELREPGIMEMKKFCKAAGIRFDYKKLVEGCTKNKERVGKMLELLVGHGLEGKPTLEKCQALRAAKQAQKDSLRKAREGKKEQREEAEEDAGESSGSRRMTRGATGVKPRQKIVISSDEEEDTPAARRTLSRLRDQADDDDDD